MTTPHETIASLAAHGLRVTHDPRNARLVISGDKAAYSAELRAAVASQRDGIIAALAAGVAGNAGVALPHNAGAHGKTSLSLYNNLPVSELERPPQNQQPPQTVALAEIASLPVALTRDLPAPCTLVVRFAGRQTPSVLTTSAARAEAERMAPAGLRRVVWSPGEYELAAYAVQEGRVAAADIGGWDARKLRSGWTLSPGDAIGGAVALLEHAGLKLHGGRIPDGALTLTWGAWLARIGAQLLEVVCESVPAVDVGAADDETSEAVL